ncbi:MAG: cobalamin biosynthesis protein CobQ [Candidatus Levybacteria bacterium]|nr:cobalamin biosynthesis protein CobQ [Candidatus Levybacteria bacterium]
MKNKSSKYTLDVKRYSLTIGWLYPELMNTYGDRGNITVLMKRCQWRGIKAEVKHLNPGFSISELKKCDLLLMGGAQDKQQEIVNKDLKRVKAPLSEMIEKATPGLYVCGGFQFLGKYYKEADGNIIEGLGIFDLYTENPGKNHPRLIGDIVINPMFELGHKPEAISQKQVVVGFENHGGRTHLGKNIKPLGKVLKGFGNNGKDGFEGAVYKNSFGTYLHGPILPKNSHFADYLLHLALDQKYKDFELKDLDDSLEWQAHDSALDKIS